MLSCVCFSACSALALVDVYKAVNVSPQQPIRKGLSSIDKFINAVMDNMPSVLLFMNNMRHLNDDSLDINQARTIAMDFIGIIEKISTTMEKMDGRESSPVDVANFKRIQELVSGIFDTIQRANSTTLSITSMDSVTGSGSLPPVTLNGADTSPSPPKFDVNLTEVSPVFDEEPQLNPLDDPQTSNNVHPARVEKSQTDIIEVPLFHEKVNGTNVDAPQSQVKAPSTPSAQVSGVMVSSPFPLSKDNRHIQWDENRNPAKIPPWQPHVTQRYFVRVNK